MPPLLTGLGPTQPPVPPKAPKPSSSRLQFQDRGGLAALRLRLDGLQGGQKPGEKHKADDQKAEQAPGTPGETQEYLASEPTLAAQPAEPVPEPSTWMLLITGLLALWLFHMRKMRNRGQGPKVQLGT